MARSGSAPDRVLSECLFRLVSLVVRRRPRDLSLTATATLGTLQRRGSCRLTELALLEGIAQPSMTALVAQLERLHLVERHADPSDGRVVLVAITPEGSEYLRTARARTTDMFLGLLGSLSPDDQSALLAAAPALSRLLDLADQSATSEPRQTEVSR